MRLADEDLQDLFAHPHGGIPDRDLDLLHDCWGAFPQLRAQLFKPNRFFAPNRPSSL